MIFLYFCLSILKSLSQMAFYFSNLILQTASIIFFARIYTETVERNICYERTNDERKNASWFGVDDSWEYHFPHLRCALHHSLV
ncbi:hypothetical protein E4T91_02205 [Ligilactobacillus murinus]|nr:hypothetical protein E4T91_02205 [Ligilactobacillus murinus]